MSAAEALGRHTSAASHGRQLGDTAWFEASCAFAILLPLLFVPQLSSAGPALSYCFTAVYAWAHRRTALLDILRSWPLLLIPLYALASVIWSSYPDWSFKHSLELWLTVVGGLLLSASRRPSDVLLGAAVAFGLFLAVSLVLGHSSTVSMASLQSDLGTSFTGLNSGKNVLGVTAAMGTVLSILVFAQAIRKLEPIGLAMSAGLLAVEVYLTYLARSAGATVGLVLAVIAFGVIASLVVVPRAQRGAVCAGLVVVLIAGAMVGYAFANSVTNAVLDVFHKDPTLTGRSYLWYRAWDFIRERPALGHGYEAFWVQGNLDAEGLWQYARILNRNGFNFHNTIIELLIHFGWVGTALTVGVFVAACVRLLGRAVLDPSLVVALCVALVVFQVARMPFESLMPSPDFVTLLIVVTLGYGFGEFKARASPADFRTDRRPRMVRARRPATGYGRGGRATSGK